jgi:hypothetical protein
VLMIVKAFGTDPQNPNWNPNLDINCDDYIDTKDILITTKNYGRTDL